MKYVIVVLLGLLVLCEYACMVANKKADEQAEELYRKYKEYKHGTDDTI